MGPTDKLLGEGERPLVVLRPHVRRVFRPALILLVLAPAAAFAAGVVPPGAAQAPVRLLVTAVALLVALRWAVMPFLLWWNTRFVLTDERFFERRGLLRRTGHDLPLQGVTDVVVAQNLGERLLRCGTLRVITEGGGEIVLQDVPAISRVQRSLLAVTDDITERLRSPRRAEEFDEIDEDDEFDDEFDERIDDRRGELERTFVHRAPPPDSPLEDDGEMPRTRPLDVRPPTPEDRSRADPEPADPEPAGPEPAGREPENDDAGGARILRFPPRP